MTLSPLIDPFDEDVQCSALILLRGSRNIIPYKHPDLRAGQLLALMVRMKAGATMMNISILMKQMTTLMGRMTMTKWHLKQIPRRLVLHKSTCLMVTSLSTSLKVLYNKTLDKPMIS